MLGTGGSLPTWERLTSCILVRDWRGLYVLLDAGEGCQIRLQQAGVSPTSIDAVAITHGHGDHVNGLAGLIQTMTLQERSKELIVIGPEDVIEFVEEGLRTSKLALGFHIRTIAIRERGSFELLSAGGDIITLSWAPTCHSVESYAFRLTWSLRTRVDVTKLEALGLRPGPWLKELLERGEVELGDKKVKINEMTSEAPKSFSVTYSGDTAPCSKVANLAKGSDLLIHESTFSAQMRKQALDSYHSSSVDAAEIALEAGVRELVLTHVSGRYRGFEAKLLEREARTVFPSSRLAWDLMRIRFKL